MHFELQLPANADPERFLLELGRGDVPRELQPVLEALSREVVYQAHARQLRNRRWGDEPERSDDSVHRGPKDGDTLKLEPFRVSDVDFPVLRIVTIVERNVPSLALRGTMTRGTIVAVDGTAFRVAEHLARTGRIVTFVTVRLRRLGGDLRREDDANWATAAASFDFRAGAPPFHCSAVRQPINSRSRSAWLGADGGRVLGAGQVGMHFSHAGFEKQESSASSDLSIRSGTPAWMGPQGVFVAAKPSTPPPPAPEEEPIEEVVAAEPEPVAEPEECGGIDDLTVTCKHDGRGLGPARKLQIVAANPKMKEFILGGSDDREDPGRKAPRKFSIGYKRSRVGGSDELTCTVSSLAPAPCGQQHVAMLRSAGTPTDADETASPITVLPPDNTDFWSRRDAPDVYHIYGKCCGGWSRHAVVESYPAKRYEFSLVVGGFRSIFAAPHAWLEEKIPWYKQKASPWMAKKAGGQVGPVGWKLGLMEPEGKFEVKMGWHEDSDWRAYHQLEAAASLYTLAGVSLEFTLSLAYIAATAALSSLGVPPPVSKWLAEKGVKYLGDIWVYAGLEIKLFLTGSLSDRYYPAGGGSEKVGSIDGGVEGAFTVGIAARIGSDYWVSVEVKGEGTVKLIVGDTLTIDSGGVTWNPAVKAPPIMLAVSFVAKAATFTAVNSKSQWAISKSKTLWEPDSPWEFFKFEDPPDAA